MDINIFRDSTLTNQIKRVNGTIENKKTVILLIGPPNVGKSVVFNKLTGLNVKVANYPGTTVDFEVGSTNIQGKDFLFVDMPGTYTLDATNEAEQITVDMLAGKIFLKGRHVHQHSDSGLSNKPDAVIFVIDANSLEHSLYLLLQLMECGLPIIVALNRTDLAREKGDYIDPRVLAHRLGVPVIPTVAINKQGIDKLKQLLPEIIEENKVPVPVCAAIADQRWQQAEELVAQATRRTSLHTPLKRQKWGDALVRPWPGLPYAVLIIAATFALIVGLGMGLRQAIFLPLIRGLIIPQIEIAVKATIEPGMFQNILIGNYGFLIKGLEWPFALILPYVISFYIALAILEDSGYLPRLGCLLDGLFQRVGLHGIAVIPLFLGYGCGIPAIMATRALSSYKERLTVMVMICLAVPCIAQTGALIALLAERSIPVMLLVFFISILALLIAGLIMDRILQGVLPPVVMELPELLLPRGSVLAKKVWVRIKTFMITGELPMIAAIGVAAVLYETGVMAAFGTVLTPLVTGWLLMPEEAAIPLILGLLRRELAVLPLIDMQLTTLQFFVGAIVALFYVPCVAILAIIIREFNLITTLIVLVLTMSTAFLVGGLFAQLGTLLF